MRKKLFISSFMFLTVALSAQAQGIFSENMFNHFAVGVTAGTPGYGLDVATTVGDYFQLRAGFTTIPSVKMSSDLDVEIPIGTSTGTSTGRIAGIPNSIDVEGKLNMTNFKLLVDVFPFKSSSFHVTVGAYIGLAKFLQVYNKENGALSSITQYNRALPDNQQMGLKLGDYLLKPDDNGNVEADIKVNGFKPYLGIGFGRAVPRKNRVGFMFEMGCQFWGSPKIYSNDHQLTSEDLDGKDDGLINVLSKITVYPVLNFRLCGRIL